MEAIKVSSLSSRRRARLAVVACALAASGGAATVAHAQEPGVVYEPGSPSAKEYAIPLEEARRDAGGARPGRIESLPFGIGLSRRGRGDSGSRSGGGTRGSSNRGAAGRDTKTGRGGGAESDDLRDRLAEAEAAAAGSLWTLGPLLLVLLPGLLVGLLLARRERGQPAT